MTADYLIREDQRFFNSLVLAIYGGDPAWHEFGNLKSQAGDVNIEDVPQAAQASLGFLSFTGKEKMFAIDGQHRLAGLREALKRQPSLASDEIAVILVGHATSKTGRERTRRLFTTLNKTARPVGKGEIIALDEDDMMAVATRHLVESDPRFMEKRIKFTQTDSLAATAEELTTIGNLYDTLSVVFSKIDGKRKLSELRYIRPPDPEVERYLDFARDFFDRLSQAFKPLRDYFEATDEAAKAIVKKHRHTKGGHILFRPIGLRLISEVLAELVRQKLSQEQAFELVGKLPTQLSDPPYRGVLWNPDTGRMTTSSRSLCRGLLIHMLGHEKKITKLHKRYADFLGRDVKEVQLPKQLV